MLREAVTEDHEALDAFLAGYRETSMFLRSNLAAHGTGWSDAPHSTRFFLWMGRNGIEAVFALVRNGFLLAQAPDAPDKAYAEFARAIAGETVAGMTGISEQVVAVLTAAGLKDAGYSLNHDEPLMALDLATLAESKLEIRAPRPSDAEVLRDWFTGYEVETGISEMDIAARNADHRVRAAMEPQSAIRLLIEADRPVAMAALNARVEDVVQVGGVYVPRALRNNGLGRRVTLALLKEARDGGANTAILFANNEPAERAYRAIGFSRIGSYRIAILSEPQTVSVAV